MEVRQTFAKVYSALRARELQTIRQIDAIWKQCGNGTLLSVERNCLQNINISYGNETSLFTEIHNFGIIDFAKLNIDSNIFTMEEYINPEEDHMYSYKCLDDICPEQDSDDSLETIINHNAIKQITQNNQCVCYVNIPASEVDRKFKDSEYVSEVSDDSSSDSSDTSNKDKDFNEKNVRNTNSVNNDILVICDETRSKCDIINNKLNPTQDWLNHIINETETEPSQVLDLMEHTTIECS